MSTQSRVCPLRPHRVMREEPFFRGAKEVAFGVVIAFGLLLFAISVPAIAAEAALKAQTRYVDVEGTKIAYRSVGTGPAIVMPNRLRGTIDTWDPAFIDALAKTHRVIMFDYPGVGYSEGELPPDMGVVADVMAKFTAKIGVKQFDIVGWSWGGAMSQVFIVRHPTLVRRAVLVATNPAGQVEFPMKDVWFERAIRPINDLADEEILFFEPRSEKSRAAAKMSRARIYARPNVADHIPSTMPEFERFFAAAQKFHVDAEGIRSGLIQSQIPMMVLAGDNDPGTPGQNWFSLIGKIPNAQLVMLPQAGHGPQHQYPELSAAYITEFLRTPDK